jgi:hypothetical protein
MDNKEVHERFSLLYNVLSILVVSSIIVNSFLTWHFKNEVIKHIKKSEKNIIKEIYESSQRQDVKWLEIKLKEIEIYEKSK